MTRRSREVKVIYRQPLRHYDDAFSILCALNSDAGPWLAEQRMTRDLLGQIIHHRRTLTAEMRQLAAAIRLDL